MAYTQPSGDAVVFQFTGTAYTRPAGSAVNFSFMSSADAVVVFSIDVTFDVAAEFENVASEGTVAFTIDVSADGEASHGIAGTSAFTIDVEAAVEAAHGVSGTADFSIDVSAAVASSHPRYSLKGEVRDGGILVNRTVRVYRRDTGALIGEQFTDAGHFDIHAGFEEREHYLLPIDLDSEAVDFTPPAANRVMSVLAMDA